jgi:hypothetical protein
MMHGGYAGTGNRAAAAVRDGRGIAAAVSRDISLAAAGYVLPQVVGVAASADHGA